MKVIIVRHGQTDDNVKNIVAGQGTNSFLNEEGIRQAKKLARHLEKEKIDVAYVSDKARAVQTLEHILQFHPSIKFVKNEKLRERHYGEFEGQPSDAAKLAAEKSGVAFELFKPKGGESHAEVQLRISEFFNGLLKKHKNDTILIVSHGRAISLLLLGILNKPIHKENQESHRPENTGFTILEIFDDKPVKLHKLNSLEHLN